MWGGMEPALYLALIAIALAYAFDFVNGFHDTANAVTTIIYTKAMKARDAIIMSGFLNFLGAVIVGTAVAMIITKVIPEDKVTTELILAALIGGLIWNVGTWYQGLPVSSSHTLIGWFVRRRARCQLALWGPLGSRDSDPVGSSGFPHPGNRFELDNYTYFSATLRSVCYHQGILSI